MMYRIIALIFVLVAVLSFVSCKSLRQDNNVSVPEKSVYVNEVPEGFTNFVK